MRVRPSLQSSPLITVLMLLLLFFSPGSPSKQAGARPQADVSAVRGNLTGKVIVVDPGHGGQNPALGDLGTVGVGPTPEKTNVLHTAFYLQEYLESDGASVVMTRKTDINPAMGTRFEREGDGQLRARVDVANRSGADVYVSLHNDWHPDPTVSGATSYYVSQSGRTLGQSIQSALTASTGAINRGVRLGNFYVLRNTTMPAVLVEIGYLSHPGEAKLLASPEYQKKAAYGIYQGLIRYFTE